MRTIYLFMTLSIDGYFEGPNHDLSWHNVDDDFNKFAIEQLQATDLILFGRRTYLLMESFWPKAATSPETSRVNLQVANLLNNTSKIVFSRTLEKVEEGENWRNVRLVHELDPGEIRRLKERSGRSIGVGGSDLAISLAKEGLIDEFRFIVNPLVLGHGTPIFKGMDGRLDLELMETRAFDSGNVLLRYRPARKVR